MGELTTPQREAFARDGHVVVEGLVDNSTLVELRRAFAEQTAAWAAEIDVPLAEYLAVVSQWTNVWERNEVFRRQLHQARAARTAAALLGCERVRVFHDHIIAKPPNGGETIPWHRDLPNLPVGEPRLLSCWLALDDAPAGAGAMRFMPGGHREPITPSIDFLNEAKDWGPRASEAVTVGVRAGSAVFHHGLSWHTSPPNHTNAWRRAYIVIYLDATCTFAPARAHWHPMTGRVRVAPGEVFDDATFPILGGAR